MTDFEQNRILMIDRKKALRILDFSGSQIHYVKFKDFAKSMILSAFDSHVYLELRNQQVFMVDMQEKFSIKRTSHQKGIHSLSFIRNG